MTITDPIDLLRSKWLSLVRSEAVETGEETRRRRLRRGTARKPKRRRSPRGVGQHAALRREPLATARRARGGGRSGSGPAARDRSRSRRSALKRPARLLREALQEAALQSAARERPIFPRSGRATGATPSPRSNGTTPTDRRSSPRSASRPPRSRRETRSPFEPGEIREPAGVRRDAENSPSGTARKHAPSPAWAYLYPPAR